MKQKIESERLSIPVEGKGQTSGILARPQGAQKRTAIIVAHGAGNDMNSPLISGFAEGLAASGYPTLRFNFLYKERGSKAPDKEETLMKTWQAACRTLQELPGLQIEKKIAAGKSMGGRIASQMVADGLLPVDRLIFLGYPLHSMTNKDKLRDPHLYRITIPMLFFEGTRDPLCDLDRLQTVLKKLGAPAELYTIDGGDHSFHVPRAMGQTEEEILRKIVDKTLDWLSQPRL